MTTTGAEVELGGHCDPRFAAVADALRENVASRDELGAAVTVRVDGRTVVDLWCGWADAARTRPWHGDTLVNTFSVGKAVVALSVLMLVSRGELQLDAPVASLWPAFAAAGKDAITVRQVLAHRAGLPALRDELRPDELYDWNRVTGALAAEAPWWEPGSAHGYHVHTFGFLAGELVRRVAGVAPGTFVAREIAGPLGADLGYGLAPDDRDRCADYVFPPLLDPDAHWGGSGVRERAYLSLPGATGIGTVNSDAWRAAILPSGNLHASARGVACLYAELVRGVPSLLDGAVLAEATGEASAGDDVVLGRPSRFGLGFQLTQPERPLGPNPRSFGHFGAGGSLGFADPDAGVAFGYVMNRGGPGWQHPRNRALVDAVYAALA